MLRLPISLSNKRLALQRLLVDIILCSLAFIVVIVFPIAHQLGVYITKSIFFHILVYGTISALSLVYFKIYRNIWNCVSLRDVLPLIGASALNVIGYALAIAATIHRSNLPPLDLVVWTLGILWAANVGFLILPRLLARMLSEAQRAQSGEAIKGGTGTTAVLVTGDSARIQAFIRDLARSSSPPQKVVGLLASDQRLVGSFIHGTQILGTVRGLDKVLANTLWQDGARPTMLVLAKDDASRQDYEQVVEAATRVGMRAARLAPVGSLHDSYSVRPINLNDLLGRPEIKSDAFSLGEMIKGRRIFVTGAGGSIGSELCRQISKFRPECLAVADSGEFNLYSIDKELREDFTDLNVITSLVNIRDRELIGNWIRDIHPDIVFHAAALKHVPMLEEHPLEGIRTNVIGTANVADACIRHGVPVMVTVSTDKAVNPCNVMGATKRMAEAYCQGLDRSGAGKTRFITVRFGNVLGSMGSVVPLFQKQIEAGGPVTVTHPEVVRFFMTIPEAVTLILQSAANGIKADKERGSIYVLDMGKPIKIVDLARQMIQLSGYRPDIDIEVQYIGLRPGEKLFEEIAYDDEATTMTTAQSILKLTPRIIDFSILRAHLQEMQLACERNDYVRALGILQAVVPEFQYVSDNLLSTKIS